MNGFLEWAGATCAAAAVCTFVHTLVGKTGVGKVFRLLTSAMVICVMLSPLAKVTPAFALPQIETLDSENTLQDTALNQMKTLAERLLLSKVNEALASHNLKAEKLELSMDISENGDISITDIHLFIPESNTVYRSWVAQIAENRLGQAVTVEFINGG